MLVQFKSLSLLAWRRFTDNHSKKPTNISTTNSKTKRVERTPPNTSSPNGRLIQRVSVYALPPKKGLLTELMVCRFWDISNSISDRKPRVVDLPAGRILIFASHFVASFLLSFWSWCVDFYLLIETAQGVGLSPVPISINHFPTRN